jgi:hypothetical protein
LITTVATTLGLLPMAIVSGLINAAVLTPLITPANYEAFEQLKTF